MKGVKQVWGKEGIIHQETTPNIPQDRMGEGGEEDGEGREEMSGSTSQVRRDEN